MSHGAESWFEPPPEYTWFDPQSREAELQAYCQGPDASWLENVHEAGRVWVNHDESETQPSKALDDAKTFSLVADVSLHLQAQVRSRALELHLEGQPVDVWATLEEIVTRADRWTGEEAAQLLDKPSAAES